jgi:hypothetical protein
MRRWLVPGIVAAVLVVGVPVVVWAASGSGGSALDLQAFKWTTTAQTSSNANFVDIPNLNNISICARGGISVDVSLEFTPSSADVRVTADGTPLKPGPMRVNAGFTNTYSFNFVGRVADGVHDVDVEWRSVGGLNGVNRGTATVYYERGVTC